MVMQKWMRYSLFSFTVSFVHCGVIATVICGFIFIETMEETVRDKHLILFYFSDTFKNVRFVNRKWPSILLVNLNSNRTCPVCTDLPDNSVYWPDHMVHVQYVALTRLIYDRGQFSWHSLVGGLTMTTPVARSDFLQYPRPIWPTLLAYSTVRKRNFP